MADARDSKSRIERCEGSSPSPGTMKKVLVIVGPTASGKSNLAVRLAKKYNGEIISADSRQVYKGLDVGTGKITKAEMKSVPHHLLDVTDPKKQFSAAQYKKLADKAMWEIVARGKTPIIVGGTGFYIDTLTGATTLPEVPPNPALRRKLEKKSTEQLFALLKKKDPTRAKNIDAKNRVRLIRALEIVEALGKVPAIKAAQSNYKFVWIGLNPKDLDKRIETRVKKMFARGLLKEVGRLKKKELSDKRLKELGFEYWQPTIESVTRGTKQYAKRQMTWFKRDKKITWYPNASSALATSRALLGQERRRRYQ